MKNILTFLTAGYVAFMFFALLAFIGADDAGTGSRVSETSAQIYSGANGGVKNGGIEGESSSAGAEDQDLARSNILEGAPKDTNGTQSGTTDESEGIGIPAGAGAKPMGSDASGSPGPKPLVSGTESRM